MGGKSKPGGPATDPTPLIEALGVTLDSELLGLALTHRSYAYENGGLPPNERLEFLGDAVLGLVVTDHLYRAHPELPEGQLAKLRASVVNMHALARVALDRAVEERSSRQRVMAVGRDGTEGKIAPRVEKLRQASSAMLEEASKPKAEVEFAIIAPVRKLIILSTELSALKSVPVSQWKQRVLTVAGEKNR